MSLEHGGRADKEGNTYENRFLARLFLQLINEEFQYIQVEAVERNSDFAEFIAVDQAGTRRYYQCKASNGDCDHWRISDLRSYDIFSNAQKIVDADTKNEYGLASERIEREGVTHDEKSSRASPLADSSGIHIGLRRECPGRLCPAANGINGCP